MSSPKLQWGWYMPCSSFAHQQYVATQRRRSRVKNWVRARSNMTGGARLTELFRVSRGFSKSLGVSAWNLRWEQMSLAIIPLLLLVGKYMIPAEENYLAFITKENILTSATLAKTFLLSFLACITGSFFFHLESCPHWVPLSCLWAKILRTSKVVTECSF